VTPLPIELTCDVTPGVAWVVMNNNISGSFLFSELANGMPQGHNHNGINILINDTPINNTQYACSNSTNNGHPYYILVAGEYVDFSTATI